MIYNMEFKGSAVKKMYMLPVSVPAMYLCKFLILTVMFLVAIVLQNLALAQIGMTDLPDRPTFLKMGSSTTETRDI